MVSTVASQQEVSRLEPTGWGPSVFLPQSKDMQVGTAPPATLDRIQTVTGNDLMNEKLFIY